jgi:hypothetical protein
MQHSIRQQLKLTEDEMRGAIDCSITREGYVEILTRKGLIVPVKGAAASAEAEK